MFQKCFKEVFFCNFVLACISSQLPEQKEGLFFFLNIVKHFTRHLLYVIPSATAGWVSSPSKSIVSPKVKLSPSLFYSYLILPIKKSDHRCNKVFFLWVLGLHRQYCRCYTFSLNNSVVRNELLDSHHNLPYNPISILSSFLISGRFIYFWYKWSGLELTSC